MQLSEINIYPIKALSGISLNKSIVEERGLQFDRRWMLTDKEGVFLTQREFPKMATLKVGIIENGLWVSSENDNLLIPFESPENEIEVRVWQDICEANLCEKPVSDWFSNVLQTDCQLVWMPENSRRAVEPEFAKTANDITSFSEGYPFLLIGESSLEDLNGKLEKSLPMNRFRPNLVVKNSAAFDEDKWKKIKIGEIIFHVVKPCARCVVTTIDQEKGEFDGKDPLKTLATFRTFDLNGKRKIMFGQNLLAETFGGTIHLNDPVEILE